MAYITGQIVDGTNEKSTFRLRVPAVTVANITEFLADAGDLQAAIDDIIIGNRSKQGWIGDDDVIHAGAATNGAAQVELGWLVTYKGNTSNKLFQTYIATANPDPAFRKAESDEADLTTDEWVAFKAAFETVVRSPDNGTETVTLVRAKLTGRNR